MTNLELLKDSSRNEDFTYQPKNCDTIPGIEMEPVKFFSSLATEAIKSNNNLAYSNCKGNVSMANYYMSQSDISEESKERIFKYTIDSNERITRHANKCIAVGLAVGVGILGATTLVGLRVVSNVSNNKSSSKL